jgi:hypothetical protein
MELVNVGYSTRITLFEKSFNKINQILLEISQLNDSILKTKYIESDVCHLINIFKSHRNGVDKRLDLTFYFYEALESLKDSFMSALCLLNKRESEIFFEFQRLIVEYYQIYVEIEPKYKVSAIEYFEFLAKDKFKKKGRFTPDIQYKDSYFYFLDDGRIIIFPLEEMLCILLDESASGLGSIKIVDNQGAPGIHIKREYSHWGGVGKDDWDVVEYYRLYPGTLQIQEISYPT